MDREKVEISNSLRVHPVKGTELPTMKDLLPGNLRVQV